MNYWLDLRLKTARFFRKHKRKIIIIFIIWAIVFAVNYYLKNRTIIELPQTTYKPHSPVIDTTDKVPESYKKSIDSLIYNYIDACNNKEYEKAYELLSEDFKKLYCKTLDEFKSYVDKEFRTKKEYNIQNFSNLNNIYVYRVRLLDNILASGTTENYEYTEEKYVIKKVDGEFKLSLSGFCGQENLNIDVEDDYIQVKIINKIIEYDNALYTLELKNKTGNYVVLADSTTEGEIQMKIGSELRDSLNTKSNDIVIYPNQTIQLTLDFTEYFDDNQDPSSLVFNSIRVLPEYTNIPENAEKENNNALKLYSFEIDLVPQQRK